MTELQHCLNETLRMYPPLIMLMRMALKDIEFEGVYEWHVVVFSHTLDKHVRLAGF
jgi:hypothetical protein